MALENPLKVSWWDRFWDYIKEGVSGGFPVNPFTYVYKGVTLVLAGAVNLVFPGSGDRHLCPGELDDALYNINFLEQHPEEEKDFFAINGASAGIFKAVLVMQQSYVSRYSVEECHVSGVLADLEDLADVMSPEGAVLRSFDAERGCLQFFIGRKYELTLWIRIKNYVFGGTTIHIVYVNGKSIEVVRYHKNIIERILEGLSGGDHHRNVFREFVHWFERGQFVRNYLDLLDYFVEGTTKPKDGYNFAALGKFRELQFYVQRHLKEALDEKYGGNRYYYRKLGLMLNRLAWRHKNQLGGEQDDYGGMVPIITGKPLKQGDSETDYDMQADALLRYYDQKAKNQGNGHGQEPWRRTEQKYNQFIHRGPFMYTLDSLGREVQMPVPLSSSKCELADANKLSKARL